MTPTSSSAPEQLSALADGQLQGPAFEQALASCAQDPQLLACWRDYHLIGEALRGAALPAPADESRFLAQLRPRLAAQVPPPDPSPVRVWPTGEAANAPWFSRRWVAGLSVVLAAAGLGWSLLGEPAEPDLALGETPLLASSPLGPVVRDAALEELLEAHRQQGGASELPMPSGFLRNATFESEPAALAGRR